MDQRRWRRRPRRRDRRCGHRSRQPAGRSRQACATKCAVAIEDEHRVGPASDTTASSAPIATQSGSHQLPGAGDRGVEGGIRRCRPPARGAAAAPRIDTSRRPRRVDGQAGRLPPTRLPRLVALRARQRARCWTRALPLSATRQRIARRAPGRAARGMPRRRPAPRSAAARLAPRTGRRRTARDRARCRPRTPRRTVRRRCPRLARRRIGTGMSTAPPIGRRRHGAPACSTPSRSTVRPGERASQCRRSRSSRWRVGRSTCSYSTYRL